MYINVTKKDCENIVNRNIHRGGGGNSDLEVALARKCLGLYRILGKVNQERTDYFEAIYSASVSFAKATKGAIERKRAADLARDSRTHFKAAVRLDGELKELADGKDEGDK